MCIGFHSQRQLCSGACSWSEGKIREQLCCTCRCHLPEQDWAEVLHGGSERMASRQSQHFEGTGAAFVR